MVKRIRVERAQRVAISLSDTALCAADVSGASRVPAAWRAVLDAPPGDSASWPSLGAALGELARAFGAADGARLAVALMPPLTEVRRLELPPLSDEELQRLLARGASKYFVGARVPQVVGAVRRARRARRTPGPVVAAAVPARLLALIHAAARDAGFVVDAVVPAEAAWAAAARGLWPAFAKRDLQLLVHHDERTDLLQIEGGRLANVRRFRGGAHDAALIVDAIGASVGGRVNGARVVAFGRSTPRRELAGALETRGILVASPPVQWGTQAESTELVAAAFAAATDGPLLRSEDVQAVRKMHERRAVATVAAAAVVLLCLAGALELWGVRRQLTAVEAQRAVLKPRIAATLVGRMSVETAFRRLGELAGAERAAPRWSSVIAAFSEHLSDQAYLTGFRARGDSVTVDGLAVRAAVVYDDIQQIPALIGARSVGSVRREAQDKGEAREHFTITARVVTPAMRTTAPAAMGKGAP
jgi:hypothetical protein